MDHGFSMRQEKLVALRANTAKDEEIVSYLIEIVAVASITLRQGKSRPDSHARPNFASHFTVLFPISSSKVI